MLSSDNMATSVNNSDVSHCMAELLSKLNHKKMSFENNLKLALLRSLATPQSCLSNGIFWINDQCFAVNSRIAEKLMKILHGTVDKGLRQHNFERVGKLINWHKHPIDLPDPKNWNIYKDTRNQFRLDTFMQVDKKLLEFNPKSKKIANSEDKTKETAGVRDNCCQATDEVNDYPSDPNLTDNLNNECENNKNNIDNFIKSEDDWNNFINSEDDWNNFINSGDDWNNFINSEDDWNNFINSEDDWNNFIN